MKERYDLEFTESDFRFDEDSVCVKGSFIGLGLMWGWGCILLNGAFGVPSINTITTHDIQLLFSMSQMIIYAGMVLLSRRFSPFYQRGSMIVAASLLQILATVAVVYFRFFQTHEMMLMIAVFIAGLGYGYTFMLWIELFACLPMQSQLAAYALSTFSFFFVTIITKLMTIQGTVVCAILLPFMSFAMLISAFRTLDQNHIPKLIKKRIRFPWQLLICLCLFSLGFGVNGGFVNYSELNIYIRVGSLIPASIVLLGSLFFRNKFDIKVFYTFALCSMLVGLLVIFFANSSNILSQMLVHIGNESYAIITFAITCNLAYRLRISGVHLYGVVLLLNISIRAFDGLFSGILTNSDKMGIPSIIIVLISATIAVVFLKRQEQVYFIPSSLDSSISERKTDFGLSPREAAIFDYLTKGYDAPQISRELFLAPSTVRAHMSNIYKKMGIHTRKDFDAAVIGVDRPPGFSK
jgi:DNA-binding CsgD family transcriptional regulator